MVPFALGISSSARSVSHRFLARLSSGSPGSLLHRPLVSEQDWFRASGDFRTSYSSLGENVTIRLELYFLCAPALDLPCAPVLCGFETLAAECICMNLCIQIVLLRLCGNGSWMNSPSIGKIWSTCSRQILPSGSLSWD